MIDFIKQFELPHISTYKWRWLRRVMIVVMMPQEVSRAIYHVICCAKVWWNWDGPVRPPVAPEA